MDTRCWSRRLVFEKMASTAFGHKIRNVREETLYLLPNAIYSKR